MNSLKLVLTTSLLVLLGCAAQQPIVAESDDPRGPVTVNVTADGDVEVNREPMHVRGAGVVLKWTVADARYRFLDNGIEVTRELKDGQMVPVPPNVEFVDCMPLAQNKMFKCKAVNPTPGTNRYYKYTIRLTDTNSNQPLTPLDPWISTH